MGGATSWCWIHAAVALGAPVDLAAQVLRGISECQSGLRAERHPGVMGPRARRRSGTDRASFPQHAIQIAPGVAAIAVRAGVRQEGPDELEHVAPAALGQRGEEVLRVVSKTRARWRVFSVQPHVAWVPHEAPGPSLSCESRKAPSKGAPSSRGPPRVPWKRARWTRGSANSRSRMRCSSAQSVSRWPPTGQERPRRSARTTCRSRSRGTGSHPPPPAARARGRR